MNSQGAEERRTAGCEGYHGGQVRVAQLIGEPVRARRCLLTPAGIAKPAKQMGMGRNGIWDTRYVPVLPENCLGLPPDLDMNHGDKNTQIPGRCKLIY